MWNRLLPAIILLSLLLGTSRLTRGHEWGDDFASYIMQAGSILNGRTEEFVERNAFTIFESSFQIGPVAYPWGYPLVLAPVYAIKGNHPLALKLPGVFFFVGFLVCLSLLVRGRLTQTENLLLVSLFAFNPMLVDFLDQILSDIPFLFFSTLALVLMTGEEKRSPLNHVLLGGVIAFAFFIRTTGVLLLASFLAIEAHRLWINRTDRQAARKILTNVLTVCAAFVFLWGIYALLFPGGGESYLAQYQAFRVETVFGFLGGYFELFSLFLGEAAIWKYFYYVLFIFFLIGLWNRRKEEPVFIAFFALWMILLITWPYWQGPRFIFALLPIFIYFTFHGMKTAIHKLPGNYHQAGRAVFYALWLLVLGIFLFNSAVRAYNNVKNGRNINGPYDPVSGEVYAFVKDETPPDSILIFFKPRAMRLMTGRDTLMINRCEGMLKGDYIILSKKVGENNQIPPERIDSCNLTLENVFKNRRFIIYEIVK
ncbi:MAG TPA: glycosyltransferase family 39 protein [Anaerolineales bacterium]|nr:glycosyltransferase family 39 protein [Anaerolineales bacterium]